MKEIAHQYPSDVKELTLDVTVIHGDYPQNRKALVSPAIWDTGASDTVISQTIVEALGLCPLEDMPEQITTTANGVRKSKAYEVMIQLDPEWPLFKVKAYTMPPTDIGVIIGLDIISKGLFRLWPNKGVVNLSFIMGGI